MMVPGWLDTVLWLVGMCRDFAAGSSGLLCDRLASALLQLCFVIRCWFGQLVRNWFAALSGLVLGYLVLSFSVGSLLVMGWFAASSWPGPWLASRCWLAHRVCGRFVGFAWWSKLVSVLLERSLRFGAGSRVGGSRRFVADLRLNRRWLAFTVASWLAHPVCSMFPKLTSKLQICL